ncbi:AAA domain-containing protein, partial [Acidobacteriota bacterium]
AEELLEEEDVHPTTQMILDALKKRDIKAYDKAFTSLLKVYDCAQTVKQKRNIHTRFRKSVPKTTEAYAVSIKDNSWEKKFSEFNSAWIWAKTDRWLNDKCEKNNSVVLNENLELLEKKERDLLRKLASKKAWQLCMKELGETERQALIAWKQAVASIKLGKGRHAETHRETARRKLEECRKAIPAWIMPLYQVVQTTRPKVDSFDYVIIDEASQSGPEALLLCYIAKKIIVVGDDKQITPLHIGTNRDQVDYLRRMHLEEIPHNEALGLEGSLFSQTELRFPGRVRLREHFRCMPEIIQFSNNLSYRAEPLIPLRQYGAERLEPIVTIHVKDGYRKGRSPNILNEPEARAIVDKIIECCEDPDYKNLTFGVISLLGGAQSTLIRNILVNEIGATEIEKRNIHCGIPYDFQGDERHVIFLSMVDAPEEARVCRMVRDAETQRRFNVAVSRAKDQLWLFHSPTLNDLRPDCLRYRLLKYCLNPTVRQSAIGEFDIEKIRQLATSRARERKNHPEPFGSWFEVDVFLKISDRGYRVLPQFEVADYRIDMVIEGLKGRLAVECDGDEWHGPDQYEHDMRRQRELERCGLIFWRVRGSEYYRAPEFALNSLWEELENLKIWPQSRSCEYNSSEGRTKSEDEKFSFETEKLQKESKIKVQRKRRENEINFKEKNLFGKAENYTKPQYGVTGPLLEKIPKPKNISDALSLKPEIIGELIVEALKKRPNYTCKKDDLPGLVLKLLVIVSRGKPRGRFKHKVFRALTQLEKESRILIYTSVNVRVKLIKP